MKPLHPDLEQRAMKMLEIEAETLMCQGVPELDAYRKAADTIAPRIKMESWFMECGKTLDEAIRLEDKRRLLGAAIQPKSERRA